MAMSVQDARRCLLLPLDEMTPEEALAKARQLQAHVGGFKVGSEVAPWVGRSELLQFLQESGLTLMGDDKFCDIPRRVAYKIRVAVRSGCDIITVHITPGGQEMLEAALVAVKDEADRLGVPTPAIAGITVLTSRSYDSLVASGELPYLVDEVPQEVQQWFIENLVYQRAVNAKDVGLPLVVASPKELKILAKLMDSNFGTITPGVRSAGKSQQDQKRVDTPEAAISMGARYVVSGSEILKPENETSEEAADRIVGNIAANWVRRRT